MHSHSRLGLLAALVIALSSSYAVATPVTSLSGTIVQMPVVNYHGGGPQTFGPGITWSSTNADVGNSGGSVFGYNGGYGYGPNGMWFGMVMAGLNAGFDSYGVSDTMTFALASPVAGVGGFINYVPGHTTPTTIAVWDSSWNLIESMNLTFLTGGIDQTGQFLGFLEDDATIKYFTLTDNLIGITTLTVSNPVPEPASLLLLGTGLVGAVRVVRRKRG